MIDLCISVFICNYRAYLPEKLYLRDTNYIHCIYFFILSNNLNYYGSCFKENYCSVYSIILRIYEVEHYIFKTYNTHSIFLLYPNIVWDIFRICVRKEFFCVYN